MTKSKIIFDKNYETSSEYYSFLKSNNLDDIFIFGDYLIKIDKSGIMKWRTKINPSTSGLRDICPSNDGGCLVCYTNRNYNLNTDTAFISKYNSLGDLEWKKTIGNKAFQNIIQNSNGEYAGTMDFKNYYGGKPAFVKFNSNGELICRKMLVDSINKIDYRAFSLKQLKNKDYIVVGWSSNAYSDSDGRQNCLVIEFNENGDIIYNKLFGGYYDDYFVDVVETSNNGLFCIGMSDSKDGDIKSYREGLVNHNGWLVKLDNNREIKFEKVIGGNRGVQLLKAFEIDNNLFVGFETSSTDMDFKGKEVAKSGYLCLSNDGEIISTNYIGDFGVYCTMSQDKEYIMLMNQTDSYYKKTTPRIVKIK
jgi:hypothetical protein